MTEITIVTGYYGSGKTEFCVNLALTERRSGQIRDKIYIADLDVVNPYFRSRERREYLQRYNIEIVGDALPEYPGRDIPAVSFGFLSLADRGARLILDLAGGEIGLNIPAGCYDRLYGHTLLCVFNLYRPQTDTPDKMIDFISAIHQTGKVRVTGLVNNSNMLRETTPRHILEGQDAILTVSAKLGIPLIYTQIKRSIYEQLSHPLLSEKVIVFDTLQMRKDWQ